MCGHLMKFRQNYFTHVRIQKFKVKSLQHQQMRFGQPQTIAGEELLMNCKQKLLYGEKRCVKWENQQSLEALTKRKIAHRQSLTKLRCGELLSS